MSKDEIFFVALVIAFAALVTTHVALCLGIARRAQVGRALLAFVVAPAAPVLGAIEGLWVSVVLWMVFAVAYVTFRLIAYR